MIQHRASQSEHLFLPMSKQSIRILLAEDEFLIASMFEDELSEAGFEVTYVPNGVYALRQLESSPVEFTCVITDIKMPGGVDGWEVARRARELMPEIHVIYVTGDSAADRAANGVPDSVLFQKPFDMSETIASIQDFVGNTEN